MSSLKTQKRGKAKNGSHANNDLMLRPAIQPMAVMLREAATAASISLSFAYAKIRAGRLRALKLRGSTRILVADLLDYLQSCPPAGLRSAAMLEFKPRLDAQVLHVECRDALKFNRPKVSHQNRGKS